MKVKRYKVRGILKRGSIAKQFSIVVDETSVRKAESHVRDLVHSYWLSHYSNLDEVKCIINKKTVRCDNV